MSSKAYYERFLNKSAIMSRGAHYVEVHDGFIVLDFYVDGNKSSRLTIPFEQLVVREI